MKIFGDRQLNRLNEGQPDGRLNEGQPGGRLDNRN